MNQVGVMHLVDSLEAGGTERMAVNLVNCLPRERYQPYLCTTRRDGPLETLVSPDVLRLGLERKHRFDLTALRRLIAVNRQCGIRILHAHSSALFVAAAASLFAPYPAVIWHDHFGRYAIERRSALLFRQPMRRVGGVIAVNEPLARWARERLRFPAERVWYIPNFIVADEQDRRPAALPGTPGARIVCVANLRPQKDHLTLITAMALVVRRLPSAHLLLLGATNDEAYLDFLKNEIARLELDRHISFLGHRDDVTAILRACDIGVLSSASEGLPLALMEYGMAGLPAITTAVGQCPDLLDHGRAGILTPPGAPTPLAAALLALVNSPERRSALGAKLSRRVRERHSPEAILKQVCQVYDTVLENAGTPRN